MINQVETEEKIEQGINKSLMKNAKCLTYQANILPILPTNEPVILTNFGNDCTKIGDFSLMTKYLASLRSQKACDR